MANRKHLLHVKSNVLTTTTVENETVTLPKLPQANDMEYGEIAINYKEGYETISIKNDNDDIVTFPNSNAVTTMINNAMETVQDELTFDETPTEGSENPVTSEGIKEYVDEAVTIQELTEYESSTPLAVGDTHDEALSKLSKVIEDNELAVASALNDLESNKKDKIAQRDVTAENITIEQAIDFGYENSDDWDGEDTSETYTIGLLENTISLITLDYNDSYYNLTVPSSAVALHVEVSDSVEDDADHFDILKVGFTVPNNDFQLKFDDSYTVINSPNSLVAGSKVELEFIQETGVWIVHTDNYDPMIVHFVLPSDDDDDEIISGGGTRGLTKGKTNNFLDYVDVIGYETTIPVIGDKTPEEVKAAYENDKPVVYILSFNSSNNDSGGQEEDDEEIVKGGTTRSVVVTSEYLKITDLALQTYENGNIIAGNVTMMDNNPIICRVMSQVKNPIDWGSGAIGEGGTTVPLRGGAKSETAVPYIIYWYNLMQAIEDGLVLPEAPEETPHKIASITQYQSSTPVAVNDSYDTAFSKLIKIISDDEKITAAALNDLNDNKQDTLVSGSNIKTINGNSILGSGDLELQLEPLIVTVTYDISNNSTTTDVTFADAWEAYNTDNRAIYVKYNVRRNGTDTLVATGTVQAAPLYDRTVSVIFGGTEQQRLTGILYTGYEQTNNLQVMTFKWTSSGITATEKFIYSGEGSLTINAPWDFPSESITFNYDGTVNVSNVSDRTSNNSIVIRGDLAAYATSANYDSDTKKIYLKNGDTVLSEIDATDFIKDGMISGVRIDTLDDGSDYDDSSDSSDSSDGYIDKYLIITFNTDAGQEDIVIPLDEIFDPELYYTKDEIDDMAAVTARALTDHEVNKQDKLTFDNTPTSQSTNPVTSDGIKRYVDDRTLVVNFTTSYYYKYGITGYGGWDYSPLYGMIEGTVCNCDTSYNTILSAVKEGKEVIGVVSFNLSNAAYDETHNNPENEEWAKLYLDFNTPHTPFNNSKTIVRLSDKKMSYLAPSITVNGNTYIFEEVYTWNNNTVCIWMRNDEWMCTLTTDVSQVSIGDTLYDASQYLNYNNLVAAGTITAISETEVTDETSLEFVGVGFTPKSVLEKRYYNDGADWEWSSTQRNSVITITMPSKLVVGGGGLPRGNATFEERVLYMTLDSTPTEDSENAVTSAGIKEYVDNSTSITNLSTFNTLEPVEVGDSYDVAFSKLIQTINENEYTVATAITELYSNGVNANDYENDAKIIAGSLTDLENRKANEADLSNVAFSGSYNDLTDTPAELALMTSITYADLVELKNDGELIPGTWYRITDYATVTTQTNTQSANHPFDVVVLALSNNAFSEEARAIQHSGDSYFANSNLNAWKVWYCLENNKVKYSWADTTNGKGVIYRLIDEWGNDCPYDFKNIQFKRKLTNGVYDATNGTDTWVYTFNAYDSTNSVCLDKSIGLYGPDLPSVLPGVNGMVSPCYKNIIKPVADITGAMSGDGEFKINNIVIFDVLLSICCCNVFESDCHNIILGSGCYRNVFGEYSRSCELGSGCYDNEFKLDTFDVTMGDDCYKNVLEGYGEAIHLGDDCCHNVIKSFSDWITFGDGCVGNTIGGYRVTMGNSCCNNNIIYGRYITMGIRCLGNYFGAYTESINILTETHYSYFDAKVHHININNGYVLNITIESGNNSINLGCSQTTNGNNWLKNITLKKGINEGTLSPNPGQDGEEIYTGYKTITHATVNDTFLTEYKPANSQVINI